MNCSIVEAVHDVVVVGGGPVGLTAALALRAQGVPVTVLEAGADGRQRPGSRAIYYHRQTLEHWNAVAEGGVFDLPGEGGECKNGECAAR